MESRSNSDSSRDLGAAGLVSARELIREGHDVTVFEQKARTGGLWVYDPNTEDDDLLELHPTRKFVHSSVYASLRTSLPHEIMGYTDFPFLPRDESGREARRFPGLAEVATYFKVFAKFYGLLDVVNFCTVVKYVAFGKGGDEMVWTVRRQRTGESEGGVEVEEEFDKAVVCNACNSEPSLANTPNNLFDTFPFFHLHSLSLHFPLLDIVVHNTLKIHTNFKEVNFFHMANGMI